MPTTPPDARDAGATASGGPLLHGRYRLTEKLGSGGMADVFLAEDVRLGRHVAVKMLRAPFADDHEFVQRFRVEAQAAALLNHPNIVTVHDRGHDDGRWYLVMEYVRGETLKARLRREGRLAPPEAASIACDLLAALQAAHDRHIVHRDVTAQNVLLADDGRVKVADFGIARIGASELTRSGMMLGTCHYISPEQARGLPADERSDIYGAGVVLFEMLTGRVPFAADSDVAVALKHVNEGPPRPRDAGAGDPGSGRADGPASAREGPRPAFPVGLGVRGGAAAALLEPAGRAAALVAGRRPACRSAASSRPAAVPADTRLRHRRGRLARPSSPATARRRRRRSSRGRLAPPGPAAASPARATLAGGGALFLAAAAVTAALLYVFVVNAGAVVPELVGRTEAEARALLRDAELRVKRPHAPTSTVSRPARWRASARPPARTSTTAAASTSG